MVSFDDIDIALLSYVADNPHSTVTDCAKSLFNPEDNDELQRKDSMLRHRFKQLESKDLISYTLDSNRKHFRIVEKAVSFRPHFNGIWFGRRKICPLALKGDYCIIITVDDGLIIKSLDKLEANWEK